MPVFRDYSQHKLDCRERTARQRRGHCPRFSPEGTCAVRFRQGARRMQCDHKPRLRASRVDFWQRFGDWASKLPTSAFIVTYPVKLRTSGLLSRN